MLTERDLKIGGKYLYWSPSKMCHIRVVYEGKRKAPGTDEDILVFHDPLTLNEVWATSLINIVVDDGWLERFVENKNDD